MRSNSQGPFIDKTIIDTINTCNTLLHATYKTKAIVKQPKPKQPKPRPTKAAHCLPQTQKPKPKPLPKFS